LSRILHLCIFKYFLFLRCLRSVSRAAKVFRSILVQFAGQHSFTAFSPHSTTIPFVDITKMKATFATAFLATALLTQQAAGDSWGNAKTFSNPSNTNNNCTQNQQSGFDWSTLPTGSFSSFGGFDFSGFSCSNSFSKRSLLARDSFQSKCVQGQVSKDASSAPKIACGSGQAFSITDMQVSVSFDTDLDFVFDMPDGSTCKHTASCSASGTTITNSQCGGAQSVSFQMPAHGSDQGCGIGIHSVGFDCQSASTPASTLPTSTPTRSDGTSTSSSIFISTPSSITTSSAVSSSS
jgi:hypothetical protein